MKSIMILALFALPCSSFAADGLSCKSARLGLELTLPTMKGPGFPITGPLKLTRVQKTLLEVPQARINNYKNTGDEVYLVGVNENNEKVIELDVKADESRGGRLVGFILYAGTKTGFVCDPQ